MVEGCHSTCLAFHERAKVYIPIRSFYQNNVRPRFCLVEFIMASGVGEVAEEAFGRIAFG